MADFHWGFDNLTNALALAEAFQHIAHRPEVVVLQIMSRINEVESLSSKDARATKH